MPRPPPQIRTQAFLANLPMFSALEPAAPARTFADLDHRDPVLRVAFGLGDSADLRPDRLGDREPGGVVSRAVIDRGGDAGHRLGPLDGERGLQCGPVHAHDQR